MDSLFLWPLSALFLFLPFVVYFFMPPKKSADLESALKVPFFHQVFSYSKPLQVRSSFFKKSLLILMWIFLVLSAMRPVWYFDNFDAPRQSRNIVLVLDVSQSMDAVQYVANRQKVTRFDLVRQAVQSFLTKRFADNIALVLFGDEAYTYAPLSYDKKSLQALLDEVFPGIAGKMTAMGEGLALGVQNALKIPTENKVVILLSDGYANAGSVSVDEALMLAKKNKVKVYTIAMASESQRQNDFFGAFFNESDVDEKTLNFIADQTGGRYFRASNQEDLNQVYSIIDQLEETPHVEIARPRQEIFFIPLAVALLLLLVALIGRRDI